MATPHDGTGANWDDTYPQDADFVADGAKEIRDLRAGILVLTTEEFTQESNGAGITRTLIPKQGAGRAYTGSAAPTNRPDGATALANAANDRGRLWIRQNGSGTSLLNMLYAWNVDATNEDFFLCGNPWVMFYSTSSGTFTNGADRTRALTASFDAGLDSGTDYTLSSNQVAFGSGLWRFYGGALGNQCDAHAAKLVAVSGSIASQVTLPGHGNATATLQDYSLFWGTFTGGPTVEVRHRCTTTKATDGFGVLTGFADEAAAFFIAIRESERK